MSDSSVLALFKGQLPPEKATELDELLSPASYEDKSGTPGNCTINKRTGRAAIDTGAVACVVTCNLCSSTSVVLVQTEDIDTNVTLTPKVVPANGSFTVTVNAAT